MRNAFARYALIVVVLAAGCQTTPDFTLPSQQPTPTLDTREASRAIEDVKGYEFGDSRERLAVVEDIVRRAQYDPENRQAVAGMLAAVLDSGATLESKKFVCKQLAVIGTHNEIPALARALQESRLSDMARYALEPMPWPEIDQVFLDTLADAPPSIQVGIINSLAERKSYAALKALRPLRESTNPSVSQAAQHAVARIEGMVIP
jgi:hypothetical protein